MARTAQIDYVILPQRTACRIHCPFEDCKNVWIYNGIKRFGWIQCSVCKRSVKLGDYPKEAKT